ncbi:MAG TPA: MFS transporter [Mesorhizobium sp.]|jgi:predicted MFS family arabinose efflux permease|nr:MFS transporter [Mesorhizobium sp.]
MVSEVGHATKIPLARQPGARTFAVLYALESFARASIASVVPIQAYDILQSGQSVAVLYTAVSLGSLAATLSIPLLIQRFSRRWVYTAGALLLVLGSVFFASQTLWGQVLGMLARVMGAGALHVALNLYIMDHVRRAEFVRVESIKMAWSTLAWTCGPTMGVFLYTSFGLWAAHGAVAAFALPLLACFWFYRLSDNQLIRPGKSRPSNPLANVGRFVAQPRLRLAWLIAFGRSCFWTTFFVYGPILMVATGQGKLAGGILVSTGNALLLASLFWGRVARQHGTRPTIALVFVAMGAMLLGAGASGETFPFAAAGFLLACAFFAVALDALGGVAFMRAVHSFERPQMAAVYRTYLDLSELLPPLAYAVVLAFWGLGSVFFVLGLFQLVCAAICWRYLPRSM